MWKVYIVAVSVAVAATTAPPAKRALIEEELSGAASAKQSAM